jgi:hypothetical protein
LQGSRCKKNDSRCDGRLCRAWYRIQDKSTINANAYESKQLLNERMGYVADSRGEHDVRIYTNSIEDLPYALARTSDKEIALDALKSMEERKDLIQQQRAVEIERTHDRGYDRGGYGYSR